MLHCGVPISFHKGIISPILQNIRQTVRLVDMDAAQGVLRTGDRATVIFEFIQRPEYLKPGMKLVSMRLYYRLTDALVP